MTFNLDRLDELPRAELIELGQRYGVERPERMTRVELKDELVRICITDAALRERSRGWLGVARDLVASVVEAGLHMPDAAKVIRGDAPHVDISPRRPPVATVTLAEIYATQGHTRRALRMLEQVLQKEPDHEVARALMEQLAASTGAMPSAKAAESNPERPALGTRPRLDVEPAARVPASQVMAAPARLLPTQDEAEKAPAPAEGAPVQGEVAPAEAEMAPVEAETEVAPAPGEVAPAPAEGAPGQGEVAPAEAEMAPAEAETEVAPAPGETEVAPAEAEGEPAPAQGEVAPTEGASVAGELASNVILLESELARTEVRSASPEESAETASEIAVPAGARATTTAESTSITLPEGGSQAAPGEAHQNMATTMVEPTDHAPKASTTRDVSIARAAPGSAWLLTARVAGQPVLVWQLGEVLRAALRQSGPKAVPIIRLVGTRSSWEGTLNTELDIPVEVSTGRLPVPQLSEAEYVRAAVGIKSGGTFRPLLLGIEAVPDGIRFRPRGMSAAFAATALQQANASSTEYV